MAVIQCVTRTSAACRGSPEFCHEGASATSGASSQARAVELLRDIREVYMQSGAQRLFSKALVEGLRAFPGRGWSGGKGEPGLNEERLARYLSTLGIAPHRIRIGDRQSRGYELKDFAAAFEKLKG